MAAGAGLPPGLGVAHATHSPLSASLLTSQTEHIQVPAFGLNKSINEGCAAFSSAFESAGLSPKLPKVGLTDESALFVEAADPKAKLGLAGSAFSPKPNPVGLGADESALLSPKRKLGLAGSLEGVDLPNAKPVNPIFKQKLNVMPLIGLLEGTFYLSWCAGRTSDTLPVID